MSPSPDITQLLSASSAGDAQAAEELLPLVYDELRALAARRLRTERVDHTLEPTALVHEAYVRLVDADRAGFNDRQHFFATAARTIRRVLIDHARARGAERRGGGAQRCTLTAGLLGDDPEDLNLIDLDAALTRLESASPRHAQVVQLRWFAGFDVRETADVLGVSPATVKNDWRAARACLRSWIDAGA
ncbi:MAG: extracytoplasmic sigma factor ECF [Planctomycetota bacterium]|nr:MAG: extracytoplasmic sigma factor ECF [Planctomycetota bacterium]